MAKRLSYDDKCLISEIHSKFGDREFTVREFCSMTSHNPRQIGGMLRGVYNHGGIDKVKRITRGNNERSTVYKLNENGLKVVNNGKIPRSQMG